VHVAPDLCIEVLSPSTALNDRYAKKEFYARFGRCDYWIVDADRQCISVYTLRDGACGDPTEATGDDMIRSTVVDGFTVRARDAFAT
jgi:Uma2 family endonuclease